MSIEPAATSPDDSARSAPATKPTTEPIPDSKKPAAPAAIDASAETDERVDDSAPGGRKGAGRQRSVAPSRFGLVLVAILAGSALFIGGFSLGAHIATTPGTPGDEETRFGPFWDVYSLIQNDFAGSPRPSQDQLVQGAIKGMLESLNDQWSFYQGPSDFQNTLLDVGGQAQGIGVQVQLQPVDPTSTVTCSNIGNGCEMAIVQPISGSPAETAGLRAGDIIVSVGGNSLDGLTIDQAIALIKGPTDTTVTLGLLRGTATVQVSVVRKIYNQPQVDVKTLASGHVAYFHILGVNQNASSQFDQDLAAALQAGQRNIILDLRGNLGGYVDDAVKIASEFIPSGTIAYQVDASGKTAEVTAKADGKATDPTIHLVVLVDGNTASASELMAGALQSHHRAKLIGSKTYGKGVVQEYLPLSNNFGGIHLTVARWLTPDKVWIQGKGLQPDVPVSSDNARAGTDPVLDAGLEQLGFPPQSSATASPAPSASQSAAPSPIPSPAASSS
jgi:carboxyl-terminal processing protease